ncbi:MULTISPECIES: DoxX family protein [Streptomyces]|uniref:DoxX family protein n=1 Tax=Streptomyces lycii TaxID=2654337 RepID=A0ABQ7FS41_9ACTN|nr:MULTISPECIES: DoxX family protein [Streptomyces]KAF4410764.1 DoxX family protein [Streptomyces lycii]PGH50765.1 hypothetical protein CRI70_10190 [Streptomyces sp. Ru87]
MFTTCVVIVVLVAAANVWSAVVDLVKTDAVLANSAEAGVPESWLPWLAALKVAGAAGLLLGLLGADALGLAAAVGLVLYYVCAVGLHVRRRVFHNIAFPAVFLGLAVAALAAGAVVR